MHIVDTHIHLNSEEYKDNWQQLIAEGKSSGLKAFIVPGTDLPSSESAVMMSQQETAILPAVGIHPHEADKLNQYNLEQIERLLPQAVAVGEIGLDYHYSFSSPQQQQKCLQANFALAEKAKLPVILHIREADQDMLNFIYKFGKPTAGGVVHCCSSDWQTAQDYLNLGFYIGITGMVTFPKLKNVAEIAAKCPADRLLIETDGPYLAPIPQRGRVCHPAWIKYTLDYIANLRGITPEALAEQTSANACNLFGKRLLNLLN
ncbi:MAG: TatD family hydrolase [Candidatus Bruticola sp.]